LFLVRRYKAFGLDKVVFIEAQIPTL